jgi:hypothetical protein
MNSIDDFKARIDRVLSELKEIIAIFESEIANPQKAASYKQAKDIDKLIESYKKMGQPILDELKNLKLNLISQHDNYVDMLTIYKDFEKTVAGLISIPGIDDILKTLHLKNGIKNSPKKSYNYERALGSKGNKNLEDYLIPVIKLMWQGNDHTQAFRQVADDLDVRYNTVSSQCTRGLNLSTVEFVNKVNNKTIIDLLEEKYSDQYHLINDHLR